MFFFVVVDDSSYPIFKECNAGFNFAFNQEAEKFYSTVNKTISERKARRAQAKLVNSSSANEKKAKTSESTSTLKKKNVKKYEIGTPINFQHVNHIGFTNNKFDVNFFCLATKYFILKYI
jgi:hypothetical protein